MKAGTSELKMLYLEKLFQRYASRSWNEFSSVIFNGEGFLSPIVTYKCRIEGKSPFFIGIVRYTGDVE